ncbi:MAG TPA: hypothetical protein PLV92_06870 [Pirellulaceae bacterium]|nr:hypothetical protein [Pirellulaceae bacterium]
MTTWIAPRGVHRYASFGRFFTRTFTVVVSLMAAMSVAVSGQDEPRPAQKTRPADDGGAGLSAQLKNASKRVAGEQTFTLKYKAEKDDLVRWKVVHLVTIDTKIRGSEQTAKTRSVSTKLWKVSQVDAEGNITFVHSIEAVDMWQSVTGRSEVRYNSRTDATPPREYEAVAKSIGTPLATVTVSPFGRVVKRDGNQSQFNAGLGDLTIPLPEQPVKLGAKWNVPDEVRIRLEDGRVQKVQTRLTYTLDRVETGVATILVKTEVLTPVNDPKVHAQLVQRLTNGSLKFDVDAGRLISRQMDLDETVVGFSGADSVMQYLARLTEELVPAGQEAASAAKPTPATKR